MTNSCGSFPINLASGIMANFGRIELFQDKIVLTDPAINTLQDSSGPTITIDFTNIVSIRLETWLYFNSKIVIEYVDTNQQKTVRFASGDTFSTNMFKTIYLYSALLNLKNTGVCDTARLSQVAIEDKISVVLMFAGCFVGLFVLTAALGFYGKEFSLLYMLIGSAAFGVPICYLYLIKARRLIKSLG